jgi:tyrosyl-tRNA synthetase
LTPSDLALNTASIDWQLQTVFQTAWNRIQQVATPDDQTRVEGPPPPIEVVNNVDWYGKLGILTFLKEVGRHARVPQMLGRDRWDFGI